MKKMLKPHGIVIHHSLTKDSQTVSWDAIKKYHIETNGFDDIGYHYGIEYANGKVEVYKGRPTIFTGAHTKEFNTSIGICVVGNYDEQELEEDKLAALVDLTMEILEDYPHLTPRLIYKHNEWASYKSCPGTKFPWAKYIAMVNERYVA